MKKILIFLISSLILFPLILNSSSAQDNYLINILEGSDKPDNQIFWHIPSSRNLQGEIVITQGDSIIWKNNDKVAHTVTSGSPQAGPSGLFDSGLFGPSETFVYKFTEEGDFPYYCSIHPWMIGKVTVAAPYLGRDQVISNVGAEFDNTGKGLEVKYKLEGTLSDRVIVDGEKKSVTFFYDPLESKEDVLIIELPEKLIDDIQQTLVDGEIIGDAIRQQIEGTTTMYVPLWPDSKEVTFVGSNVISNESTSGGGCLIATATYGSELATQVQYLRELRDSKLLSTPIGSSFMDGFNTIYYSFSPTVADLERENPVFKEAVKLAITPMISSLSILNNLDLNTDSEVLLYGSSIILLNLGIYLIVPFVVWVGIKKRKQSVKTKIVLIKKITHQTFFKSNFKN